MTFFILFFIPMTSNDNNIGNVVVAIVAILAIIAIALYTMRLFQAEPIENDTEFINPPDVNIGIPGTTGGNGNVQRY